MIDIPEEVAKATMKDCRTFADSDSFDDFKDAVLNASPTGEHQSESTALIAHGRLLALRDVFDLIKRTAYPPAPPKKVKEDKRGSVDPDLDDGREED